MFIKKSLLCLSFLIIFYSTAGFAATNPNEIPDRENSDVLTIGTYIPAQSVARYLNSDEGLEQAVNLLKAHGVSKVFIDVYRDGYIPDKNVILKATDYFRKNGFTVAGGITTTKGKLKEYFYKENDAYMPGQAGRDFGVPSETHKYYLCYDFEQTKNDIQMVAEYAGSLFDEVIVDDFLATDCRSKQSEALKNDLEWVRYFRNVMVDLSKNQIVGAIKKVNPNAVVTIKYPQWYDRYHMFGYDVSRQPDIFDQVWAGTETRDPEKENCQQYQGFITYNWLESLSKGKMKGAWFDQINTYPEVYMEQTFQSLLSGAPEITLFYYSPEQYSSPNTAEFAKNLPYIFDIARNLKGLKNTGVYAYKPVNSNGGNENFLFDYLGMFGIPVVPVSAYPEKADSIILSEYAAADTDIAKKIKKSIDNNTTVLMSAGLLDTLKKDPDILKLAGLAAPGSKILKAKYTKTFQVNGKEIIAPDYVEIGEKLRVDDAKIIATAEIDGKNYPVLTLKENAEKGKLIIFNARTFNYMPDSRDLVIPHKVKYINTPGEIAQEMRNLATGPSGITITMPARVGSYLFENKMIAFDNFRDENVQIEVKFERQKYPDCTQLKNIYNSEILKIDNGGNVKIELPGRRMYLFKID
ncbi:MAG TPA: hypothetical protein PLN69_02680 [bacterium]|nr:hypothetical protein [bacterium]